MKGMCAAVCLIAMISMFGCASCDRSPDKTLESNVEFRQIKASLDESQRQRGQLQDDVTRLARALTEAESKLADTKSKLGGTESVLADTKSKLADATKAKNGLQLQVQELTTSRSNLEAKVDELDKVRVNLEARVNDLTKSRDDLQTMVGSLRDTRGVLEKQVASLTKAKNAALEDARSVEAKVGVLNDKLKAQTQQMIDLQGQIMAIRSVLEQLQE